MSNSSIDVLTSASVGEYFQNCLSDALREQKLDAQDDTIHYLVNLLTRFVHAENLFKKTPDGVLLEPLAELYAEASVASDEKKYRTLQRLGDIALFVCGLFSESLNRKLVDVDYYISMGGSAYAYLSDISPRCQQGQLAPTFQELSEKFVGFVDVLSEVSEQSSLRNNRDLLRIYELWLRTGSPRAAERLRSLGIEPNHAASQRHH